MSDIEELKEQLSSVEKELRSIKILLAIQTDTIKELHNKAAEKDIYMQKHDELYALIDEIKTIAFKNDNHFVAIENNIIDLNKICTVKSEKVLNEEKLEIVLINGVSEKYHGEIAAKLREELQKRVLINIAAAAAAL